MGLNGQTRFLRDFNCQMGRSILAAFSGAFLTLLAAVSAQASVVERSGWMGGTFGLLVPSAVNTTSRTGFGVQGGAKLGTELGIGAYYVSSTKSESVNGVATDFNFDLFGAQAGYHFEGEAQGAYFAGRLGLSKVKSGTTNFSPAHFGVLVGFDRLVGEFFSVGGELSYMVITGSDVDGKRLDQNGILGFSAAAKFWF
jgi:hypothetical protein